MLKTTSLVTAVPYSLDLFARSRDIATSLFAPVPLLLVASAWYLAITSVLMVGQYYLEKRFARGIGAARPTKGAGGTTAAPTTTAQFEVVSEAYNTDEKEHQ
jgi:polar amino acid transport system permease protein